MDYQEILTEMNRPSRRQGRSLKKTFAFLFVLALLGGGAFALWHYGIVTRLWAHAAPIYASVANLVRSDSGSAESGQSLPGDAASAASAPTESLRPPASLQPPPRQSGPVDVAAASVAVPVREPVASAASLAPPPVSGQRNPEPAGVGAATPAVGNAVGNPAAPVRQAPPSDVAPAVLSDARAQLRVIDQMLNSNPAEAMRRIEDMIQNTRLEPDDMAEAGYRMGYAARMLRDEAKAEKSWKETAEKWPALRGGRFAALALADTWYSRYAGDRPQVSYWDDMQVLYSQVLGQDDAPFLPDNVKAKVKANLNRINDTLLFGSGPTKLARYHTVAAGELLGAIGNKYRVDYESIARVNGINPNRIRQGMDLKVVVGEVSIVVRKNERDPNRMPTVTWFIDGRWAREYPACVGDGVKTPAGTYTLTLKERDPSWTNPANGQLLPNHHPENILGSRWMAMKGMNTTGLGIHGTTVDDSIPGYTSAGCVRLLNKDVEELYSFARLNNRVTILE